MKDEIILLISGAIVVALLSIYYLLFKAPTSTNRFTTDNPNLNPTIRKLVKIFGPDIINVTPESLLKVKEATYSRTEIMLRKSGNPWDLSVQEFVVIKYVTGFVGFIIGAILGTIIGLTGSPGLGGMLVVAVTFISFMYPTLVYSRAESERELEFIKTLPNAIDLLSMTLSGGNYTLVNAIEKSLTYLEPSPIKEELLMVHQDTESGMSISEALNNFADRVPTEGIKSFVRALNNANEHSVDMKQILENRAVASREDLRKMAEKEIHSLPIKILIILMPTVLISMVLIAISPAAYQILQML